MNKESRGFEKTARAARPPARVPSFPTERGAVFHCPGDRSAPRRHRGRGLGSPGGVMTSRHMLPGPVRCGGRDPHPRPASAAAAMAAAHQRDPQRGQLCYTCSAFRCFFFKFWFRKSSVSSAALSFSYLSWVAQVSPP